MPELPIVLLTGASGFLGSRLVRSLRGRHRVIAVDRRPQREARVPDHPNVRWHQIDLADPGAVADVFAEAAAGGPVHALVHLAAYYDYTGEDHPEYRRSNVEALRVVLDASLRLRLRRFVFASSLAACPFTRTGEPVREETPPGGDHVYAVTKRIGEEMLREHAGRIPSCAIRFAALFSDWCEYPPLYVALGTWLSERWNARVIAGRGETAIPFLHVREAAALVVRAIDRTEPFAPAEILIASTDGSVSQKRIFEAATRAWYGTPRRPLHVPRLACGPGLRARDLIKRLLGDRPFERPWMARFIDTGMNVDASRTRARLDWAPHPRLDLLNRIPFMLENLRSDPMEWYRRNRQALDHLAVRPGLEIYRLIRRHEEEIGRGFAALLSSGSGPEELRVYLSLSEAEREEIFRLFIRNLIHAVRTSEKAPFMDYCGDLAARRARQGFPAEAVIRALRSLGTICEERLLRDPDGRALAAAIRHDVGTTIEFGCDRVLETYEDLESGGD